MSFEKYTQFYSGETDGATLRSGRGSKEFYFTADPKKNKSYRLFTVGETAQFYLWKNEPDSPQIYRMITDALDTKHAVRDRYCLDLSCRSPKEYIKRIYKKIPWPPMLSYLKMTPVPNRWLMGVTVSARDIKVYEGGYLRMRIDIRKRKDGIDPRSVAGEPDDCVILDFPKGTYDAKRISTEITIPEDTAHVGVFVEGKRYSGECYVEAPMLSALGQNLLPSFSESTPSKPQFEWVGQYLSRKEWPEFCVRLNGQRIFEGEAFERCHRHSEWELELPQELLQKENVISYELISDYHDPLPYTIYEAGIIERDAGMVSIVSVSENASEGGYARVLIRTEKDNVCASFKSMSDAISANDEFFFAEKGLHGILIRCDRVCENAEFVLSCEGVEVTANIKRIVKKGDDGVITGTGDMVYVHQDRESFDEYISWFISNGVGDLVTIRPVYRWSGTRTLDKSFWKYFCRLMNELDLKYVLMRDGREVEGLCAQPDADMLAGKGFLGIQMHEVDNTYYYGGLFRKIESLYDEMCEDLISFAFSEDSAHSSSRWNVADDQKFVNGIMCSGYHRDMQWSITQLRKKSVNAIQKLKRSEDTRHTGPSAMFKYLAEAGFDQLGAETMYNTMEPLLGFLRGVVKDKELKPFGVHHAVQWSTTPHNTPARYRRYRIALYASYILGADEINTEEGLWHMEEYYNHHHRFGEACLSHLKQQADFFRYVSSHTRSGSLYSPFALIHGRDDGATFFGKDRTWGRRGMPQTPADDSWDLLKTIYPTSNPVERMYVHNCPEDKPQGFHSGTPYGNVDAVPMDGRLSTLAEYRALAFLGYNRYQKADAEKLVNYVSNGGRILLTRAHLTTSDDFDSITSGKLAFEFGPMSFSKGEMRFKNSSYGGKAVSVCENYSRPDAVLDVTDDGIPLVCVYRVGSGEIILFNTREYPSHSAIRELYADHMRRILKEELDRELIWGEGSDTVEFAVYKQEDGSTHVYFLAVDWYSDPNTLRKAGLRIGECTYPLEIPFGVLIKCVSDGVRAAWAESEDGEVISVDSDKIYVQGVGKINFCIAYGGHTKRLCVDFSDSSPKIIDLNLHF